MACSQRNIITQRVLNSVNIRSTARIIMDTNVTTQVTSQNTQNIFVQFDGCVFDSSVINVQNFSQSQVEIINDTTVQVTQQQVNDIRTQIQNEVESLIREYTDPITKAAESLGTTVDAINQNIRNIVNNEIESSISVNTISSAFAASYQNQNITLLFTGAYCSFVNTELNIVNTIIYEASLTNIISNSVDQVLRNRIFTDIDNEISAGITSLSAGALFGIVLAVIIVIIGVVFLVIFLAKRDLFNKIFRIGQNKTPEQKLEEQKLKNEKKRLDAQQKLEKEKLKLQQQELKLKNKQ